VQPVFSWCGTHLRKTRAIVFAPLPGLIALLVALAPVRDLLFCAKLLFVAARRSNLQRSPTGHLNRRIDGVFEIVHVVRRGLISIAEVHAIIARANLAQSEPEMARDRFGFLKRHSASMPSPLLSRLAPRAGFAILRQTFVRRCQNRVYPKK